MLLFNRMMRVTGGAAAGAWAAEVTAGVNKHSVSEVSLGAVPLVRRSARLRGRHRWRRSARSMT